MRCLVWIGLLLTGLYHFVAAIVSGILCDPRYITSRDSLMNGLVRGQCRGLPGPLQSLNEARGTVNIITDVYLLLIPLPVVWQLRLPTKKKLGVWFIFLIGVVGCLMAILNVVYRDTGRKALEKDMYHAKIAMNTVMVLENAVGVCIPCMASCVNVFARYTKWLRPFFDTQEEGYRHVSFVCERNLKQEVTLPAPVLFKVRHGLQVRSPRK
ncbi:hypothetical protein BKA63DRAFT_117731 [Paraphoma chrysanthemicola]|nr:hypothetical protein BKA63DRAFT_117731 [Paraphoma chrysanthemicola]